MSTGRIIAIDYGKARVGMAMSDERCIIASPLPTVKAGASCEATANLILKEVTQLEEQGSKVKEIVVGLPLKMSGEVGTMAVEAKKFADLLREKGTWTVTSWDERLSTVQAERAMIEGKMNRKRRSKAVDSVTAVILLQSYLDKQSNSFFQF